jgi:hypothetical protein
METNAKESFRRKCYPKERQQQKVLYFYDGSDANNFLYAFYANSHRARRKKGNFKLLCDERVPRNIVYAIAISINLLHSASAIAQREVQNAEKKEKV